MAFQFTDANFKKEALEADMPVLVDFMQIGADHVR